MRTGNVVIALPPDERAAAALLRSGRRVASQLGTGWIAVFIARSTGAIARMRELVVSFGGELIAAAADDVASAVVDLSSREGAQLLVIGRSRRPRLLRRLVRGTTSHILRAPRAFDVMVAPPGGER
ncbi:MAG TPA: hypothetical protein VLU46_02435 [Thermoanaerobaculia bacterium]|nr:hypothetical protein [Thermoanaerobaculia bacterium]